MNKLFFSFILLASISASAQFKKKESVQRVDTLKVKPNELQIERLNELQKKISDLNAQYEDLLHLILGVRKEEIEKLDFKDGQFIIIKKQK